jgi:hypothetical protein
MIGRPFGAAYYFWLGFPLSLANEARRNGVRTPGLTSQAGALEAALPGPELLLSIQAGNPGFSAGKTYPPV